MTFSEVIFYSYQKILSFFLFFVVVVNCNILEYVIQRNRHRNEGIDSRIQASIPEQNKGLQGAGA